MFGTTIEKRGEAQPNPSVKVATLKKGTYVTWAGGAGFSKSTKTWYHEVTAADGSGKKGWIDKDKLAEIRYYTDWEK